MRTYVLLLVLAYVCVSLAQDGKRRKAGGRNKEKAGSRRISRIKSRPKKGSRSMPNDSQILPLTPIEPEIERPTTFNSYLAVTPTRIRPTGKMTIPVYFLKRITTGQTVTGVLMDRENKTISTNTVSVDMTNPTNQVQINLDVPKNIGWGTYYVELNGTGDIPFFNRTSMYSNRRALVILVQTDKAVYKPGEKVQYRIFTIDGNLIPIATTLDIDFHDPGRHKIDERNGEMNINGLIGELQLADRPPLGRWQITVRAKEYDETKTYSFDVQEYVLPKFEVTVSLPKYALSEDNSDLTGSVKAYYTFGKPVKGRAIITLSERYGSSWFNVRGVQIEKDINGEVDFAFKKLAIERLSRYLGSGTSLKVNVNVTETITGITLGGEGSVQYYSNPYKIEFFPNMPDNFKPGFSPYKGLVKVTLQDGSPPPLNPLKKLYITVTYFTESKVTSIVPNTVSVMNYKLISPFLNGDVILKNAKDYDLLADGTVKFDVDIPADVATFSIKAEYEKQKVYKDVSLFRSRGDTTIKAELLTTDLKINDKANIKFTSNTPATVYYMVQAKGKIAELGQVSVNTNNGMGKFSGEGSFVVTKAMAPSAKFVGFLYNTVNKEVFADGLNFVVEDIFENKVSLSFNNASQTVLPASDIALQVSAAPGSFIAVLAVDKSVKLLKEGNDITQQRVKDELRSFGDSPWFSRGWGTIFPWSMTADDTNDIFTDASLKLLTDAYVEKFDLWRQQQTQFKSASPASFSSRSMAMMSDSAGGSGGGSSPSAGQVRKDFPETWMWETIQSSSGSESIAAKVPDTITEFQATAFAISPTAGLGVAEMSANLTVFKPFFVNLQIPYSIIRGEIAVIQANVFNYRATNEYVTVRLEGSPDFDSITIDANGNEVPQSGNNEQCILVPSKQPTAVFFSIKPKVIKDVILKVRASIPSVPFDEVQRPLPVKAEGIEKSKNIPLLFSVRNNTVGLTETKTIAYPLELVENSEQIAVSVIGDLFGPSLRNLDKLINIPYGCGEQNLVKFAPVVFTAKYIRDTQRNLTDDPELEKKIKEALKQGYQRQLLYQRHDGSFSAFGNADESGSSWLTAFVVKSFAQAYTLNLAYFDVNVIDRAVKYIIDRSQTPNGDFTNVGVVNNKALQGGSTANIRALTAYKATALLEVQKAEILKNPDTILKLNAAIIKAMDFLRRTPPNHQPTDYERAITAYAFQLGGRDDTLVISLLTQLEDNTISNITMGADNRKYWNMESRSLEIELASYVLMTYARRRNSQGGYMILNWLVDQRNPYGGFVSTQDTVVALQALSEFAVLVFVRDVNAEVTIFTTSKSGVTSPVQTVSLTSLNHDILHLRYFDGTNVASVTTRVTGSGLAMVDISTTYNVKSEAPSTNYDLNVISKDETKHSYTLNVCASYIKPDSTSNMAIIDAGAISGFEPVMDGIQMDTAASSPSNIRIKRKELSNKRAILYFDEIPKTPGQVCVNIPFQQETIVVGPKPANVIIYSYYEPDEKESKHYLPTILANSNLCQTCGADCGCPSTTPPKTLPLSMCGAGVQLPVAPVGIPAAATMSGGIPPLSPNY